MGTEEWKSMKLKAKTDKIMNTESCFFENINKFNKLLPRLIKKAKRKPDVQISWRMREVTSLKISQVLNKQ